MDLSEDEKILLDAALNIRSLYSPDPMVESLKLLPGKNGADPAEALAHLERSGIITKQEYQWRVNLTDAVIEAVSNYLAQIRVSGDTVVDLLEAKIKQRPNLLNLLIEALGRAYKTDTERIVSFSDGEWGGALGSVLEELVRDRICFRSSSNSRKHSYRTFYFRTWPFDCYEIIMRIVLKHLNVQGLADDAWQVLGILLLGENLESSYASIKKNVSFSDAELRDVITDLKERGLVQERFEQRIGLVQSLKEPVTQYFKLDYYPRGKTAIISALKQRIGRNLSALWLLLAAKRIYDSPYGETRSEPLSYKTVSLLNIKEFEPSLEDLRNLGIVLESEKSVIVLADVIKEVETWLKGSIRALVFFIPAGDYFMARSVFQDIFKRCDEYVKIQDPYIGEDTFDLVEYVPKELEVRILTGINPGDGEDSADIASRIERQRSERKGEGNGRFNIVFVGDRTTGDPPFHDRFIISKSKSWMVGTSLKQVGKGKDTVVFEIPKDTKDESIEPTFERWWNSKDSELAQHNRTRLDFQKWREWKPGP